MKQKILQNLLRPVLERLGTMAAAYLIATGLDSDLAAQLVNSLLAVLLVGLDIAFSRLHRQQEIATLIDRESHLWPFRQDGE